MKGVLRLAATEREHADIGSCTSFGTESPQVTGVRRVDRPVSTASERGIRGPVVTAAHVGCLCWRGPKADVGEITEDIFITTSVVQPVLTTDTLD